MGTIDKLDGEMMFVVYSYPKAVLLCEEYDGVSWWVRFRYTRWRWKARYYSPPAPVQN